MILIDSLRIVFYCNFFAAVDVTQSVFSVFVLVFNFVSMFVILFYLFILCFTVFCHFYIFILFLLFLSSVVSSVVHKINVFSLLIYNTVKTDFS